MSTKRLVVAITGASGALYAARFIHACLDLGIEVELVVSDLGHRLLIEELALNLKSESMEAWLERSYGAPPGRGPIVRHNDRDLGAAIASGSRHWDGMVVIPCSMKTLSSIAHGAASNLVERAADVSLKERRSLVVVPRETPMNLVHLDNLVRVARAGAIVVPAMPAFYQKPETFEDLADFVAGRVLSVLGIRHELFPPWRSDYQGPSPPASSGTTE